MRQRLTNPYMDGHGVSLTAQKDGRGEDHGLQEKTGGRLVGLGNLIVMKMSFSGGRLHSAETG